MNNNNTDDAVSRGLAQSAAGETVDLGDFTQYLIPDAAVEAAAQALYRTEYADRDLTDALANLQSAYRADARAVLSAALPFLGAAPSATHEDVTHSITLEPLEVDLEALTAYFEGVTDEMVLRVRRNHDPKEAR